jgi:hypothetical protein
MLGVIKLAVYTQKPIHLEHMKASSITEFAKHCTKNDLPSTA